MKRFEVLISRKGSLIRHVWQARDAEHSMEKLNRSYPDGKFAVVGHRLLANAA